MSLSKTQQGIAWTIAWAFISALNDTLTKTLGCHLHGLQVTFLRALWATLTLLPFVLWHHKTALKSQCGLWVHVVRALLLCAGMGAWSVALSQGVPLSVATMMSFSIPIIVLPLAFVFLNDRLTKKRLALTAFGFMGIVCILQPSVSCASSVVGVLFMAALFFATLDVLNKKIAVQETMLSMLFYTSFGLLIFTAMPLWWVWKTPHMTDMMLAFLLGAGGNLIFFCILKAFSCVDLSVLSPVRYIELPFTLCIGYVWFNEVPTTLSLVGTVFIVISALAIARQP